MAKAKKSETQGQADTSSSARKPVRKKKAPPAALPGGRPLVDTSFAAEAAARMLIGRAKQASAPESSEDAMSDKESGSFKQMKESLNKPAGQISANALGSALGPNKSNLPAHGKSQVVHNQTTNNFSRINVPRRTGG